MLVVCARLGLGCGGEGGEAGVDGGGCVGISLRNERSWRPGDRLGEAGYGRLEKRHNIRHRHAATAHQARFKIDS